jgi:two-component system sensor histidine kinase KdpD
MVDLTPRALLNRLARGVVYPPERAKQALENFFQESTLVALRELAMRQAAYAIESRLPGEEPAPADATTSSGVSLHDRLLLLVTPNPSSAALIRRARRVADYLRADCLAVYVSKTPDLAELSEVEREHVERHLNFARALRIEARILQGADVAKTVIEFARVYGVTQIFVAREQPSTLRSWFASAFVQRIVNLARDMQVTVVADRSVRQSG